MGYYSPNTKLAIRLNSQPETAGGRPPGRPPTVIFLTVGSLRSTGRSTVKIQRAKLSGRSTARSTAQVPGQRAQACARRSTARSTDSGSGRLAGRPPEPGNRQTGSENLVLNYCKNSHKSSKIPQKYFYHFTLINKLVIKISRQISKILNHFCVL